jgi:hypothetical protein
LLIKIICLFCTIIVLSNCLKSIKTMKRILLMALPAFLLLGCYPEGPEYVEDLDVVFTTFNDAYDFQGQNTYAMPDKIVIDVEIDRGDTTFVYMEGVYANQILDAIEANMQALGWTRLANDGNGDADPDAEVVLSPAAISSTTYYYSYWYDWYGGYYGWYYPPYYSVSSVTTGSLIMVISDLGDAADSPIGKSEASWLAVANGVAGYNDINRVTKAIDQAFKQSPYLKIN